MNTKRLIVIFFILSIGQILLAQDAKILSVKVEPFPDHFKITYLMDALPGSENSVKLFLKRESVSKFVMEIEDATGSIGTFIYQPGEKEILWYPEQTFIEQNKEVDDFYFDVQLFTKSKGIPWYYYAGGALLGGGAAAVLLLGKSKESTTSDQTTKIGEPPGRP